MSRVPSPATRYAVVAVGGAGGALLRAGISELVPYDADHFPTALLLTQTLGCALAGLATPWLLRRGPLWSLGFLTGALASFTTYGLFTGEILALATDHLVTAVVYLLAATAAGVAAAAGGLALATGERLSLRTLSSALRPGDDAPDRNRREARPGSGTGTHPIRSRDEPRSSPVRDESRRWRS